MDNPSHDDIGMMSQRQCLDLLRRHDVARIAFVLGDHPEIFPFSYRVVERESGPLLVAIQISPGGGAARAGPAVCVELDEIDPENRTAWSVVARGRMRRIFPGESLPAPSPWIGAEHREWRMIEIVSVTGRTFVQKTETHPVYSVEWQVG